MTLYDYVILRRKKMRINQRQQIKISFSVADLPLNLSPEELFRLAQKLGVSGIEVIPGIKTFPHLKKLRYLSSYYNVPILTIHQPFFRGFGAISIEESLQLAKVFDASYVLHPNSFHPLTSQESRKYFARYRNLSRKLRVNILVENMASRYTLPVLRNLKKPHPSTSDLMRLQSICEKYQFGITLDTSHFQSPTPHLTSEFQAVEKLIKNIHLSNFTTERQHLSLTCGQLKTKELLLYLRSTGYSGLVTLELSPNVFVNRNDYYNALISSISLVKKYLWD